VRRVGIEITLRGDTDFTLTAELDRWAVQGIKFIFGMDDHPKVVSLAQALPEEAWKPLERSLHYQIATDPGARLRGLKRPYVADPPHDSRWIKEDRGPIGSRSLNPNIGNRRWDWTVHLPRASVKRQDTLSSEDLACAFIPIQPNAKGEWYEQRVRIPVRIAGLIVNDLRRK
jgi:hypothetical protein